MADENVNSQAQASQEPQDIAQAFQMVREGNQAAAQPAQQEEPSVQEEAGTQAGPGGGEQGELAAGSGGGDYHDGSSTPAEYADGGRADNFGGYAAPESQIDYAAVQNNLIAALQNEAQRNVLNKFNENNIKILDVGDLYERREDGTVIFNNPDDPNRPFDTRADAQDWIDSMNKQVQAAYHQEIYKEQQALYNQAIPALELLRFGPIYDAMTLEMQDIFDGLIDPYSITNANGEVIGFNCDLNAMARQAIQIVERYGLNKSQQQAASQQQQQQQAKTPAMDLKSGSGMSNDDPEPTNLAEAMALLNKQNKEKKNGN